MESRLFLEVRVLDGYDVDGLVISVRDALKGLRGVSDVTFLDNDDIVGDGAGYDDDDFPMSAEYNGLWGGSDWQDELTAQQEAEYERNFFGDE